MKFFFFGAQEEKLAGQRGQRRGETKCFLLIFLGDFFMYFLQIFFGFSFLNFFPFDRCLPLSRWN